MKTNNACSQPGCYFEAVSESKQCWQHVNDKAGYIDDIVKKVKAGFDFRNGYFARVRFGEADLSGGNFHTCNFKSAFLKGANLENADFSDADLTRVNLETASCENTDFSNATIDMCWSWIINPVGAKDFLKKYLVTAPTNKILTFGADYIPVEPVLGHAVIARQGIALALSELVEEGWMSLHNALELVNPIMHGNARRIFRLEEKERILKNVKWG